MLSGQSAWQAAAQIAYHGADLAGRDGSWSQLDANLTAIAFAHAHRAHAVEAEALPESVFLTVDGADDAFAGDLAAAGMEIYTSDAIAGGVRFTGTIGVAGLSELQKLDGLVQADRLTQSPVAPTWVVVSDGDAADLADALGIDADRVAGVGVLDGGYVVDLSDASPSEALAALKGTDAVIDFEPLVARQQSLRSLGGQAGIDWAAAVSGSSTKPDGPGGSGGVGSRAIPNDTLFGDQWHLLNTGQNGGTAGEDANVTGVWDTYRGTGVVIGIVDDGLELTHPDLSPNYLASASYDFNFDDNDPSPGQFDNHGTAVAGVAGADGFNGIGVSGAAPDAQLAGIRLIAAGTTDQQESDALGFMLDTIDIFNHSWGPADNGTIQGAGLLTQATIADGAANGRGGLGTIHMWAGGNGLQSDDNVNYDGYANNRHTIAIGAINHFGEQSFYSEPGAPLIAVAHSNGAGPGITTTDLLGGNGYSGTDYANDFGGTSSATPLAAGVVALVLEANPNLTLRDVQHILVESSAITDAADADWLINGAGHDINHKYGFGQIDAAAAVALAETWQTVDPEVSVSSATRTPNLALPDNNATGVSDTVTVTDDIVIEWVEIDFQATHTYRGDLRITLVSPDGTESKLAEPRGDGGNDYDWTFTSARHWGESSAGDWTIRVSDEFGADLGTFDQWTLHFHGTAPATSNGDAPVIDRVSSTVRYVENRNPNYFARSARVSDADTTDFGGAVLTVGLDNGLPEDFVGLRDGGGVVSGTSTFGQGSGVVQIGVSGVGVFDVADAVYSGDSMTLTFRAGTTAQEVTQVLRRAAYMSDSEDPDLTPRTIAVSLTDPDGNTSAGGAGTEAALNLVSVADATQILLPPGDVTWTEGGGPVAFGAAVITDADTTDFGGSRLDVVVRTPRDAGDVFVFDHAASTRVAVSGAAAGSTVSIDGVAVATLVRGTVANRMVLDMLAGATAADVSLLASLVAFDSSSDAPRGPKQVAFTMFGADGARGAAIASLEVVPVNDPPTILNVGGRTAVVTAGTAPQRLATSFAIDDPDFLGGAATLFVDAIGSQPAGAALTIAADPAGRVTVAGSQVSYNGTVVGTATGLGTTSLTVAFNSSASVAAVRSVGRLVAYSAATGATAGLYDVEWDFSDELGGLAVQAETLTVDLRDGSSLSAGDAAFALDDLMASGATV